VRPTPRSRWPIVATSIPGIAPETWQAFKARADARGMTDREAMEAAILELAEAVRAGEDHAWPHPRKAPLHTFRTHGAVKARLRELVDEAGLKKASWCWRRYGGGWRRRGHPTAP